MVDALLAREQELFKLNEQINASSPKLFNKNESFAISTKNIDKSPIKIESNQMKPPNSTLNAPNNASTNPPKALKKATNQVKEAPEHDKKAKPHPEREVSELRDDLDDAKSTTSSKGSASSRSSTHNDPQPIIESIPKLIERNVTNKENLIKFLKSKVAILQNELESAVAENQEMNENFKQVSKQLKRAEAAIEHSHGINSDLQKSIHRLEGRIKEMEKIGQAKDDKLGEAKRVEAEATSECRKLKACNRTLEKRLHRALEDLEASKAKLESLSSAEKVCFHRCWKKFRGSEFFPALF